METLKLCLCLQIVLFSSLFAMVSSQEYRQGQYRSMTQLFGVTYSPFQLDLNEICLPVEKVESDMKIIKSVADHVRLYNMALCPEVTQAVLNAVKEYKMRAIVGVYLSGDVSANQREVDAIRPIVEEFGDILDCILVGNEVLFSEVVPLDDLLYYVKEVKSIIAKMEQSIPVTTGDVWPVYESSIGMKLVEATDFLCMNMQPFWEGWDIVCPKNVPYTCASAGEYVHLKAEGLEEYFGKPVWICESGWPTEGERCCEGRDNARDGLLAGPSGMNATIFINELVMIGRAANRPTYVHAMFDESWKRIWSPCLTCEGLSTGVDDPTCNSCEVDYHFGIYGDDRRPKPYVLLPPAPVTIEV